MPSHKITSVNEHMYIEREAINERSKGRGCGCWKFRRKACNTKKKPLNFMFMWWSFWRARQIGLFSDVRWKWDMLERLGAVYWWDLWTFPLDVYWTWFRHGYHWMIFWSSSHKKKLWIFLVCFRRPFHRMCVVIG